jgi:NAD-dependent SIR2 family protein deacetylase
MSGINEDALKQAEKQNRDVLSRLFDDGNIAEIKRLAKAQDESDRLAIYCTHCRMWFDTKKGWQAKQAPQPFSIPICPCCGAPLMELDYDQFIRNNEKQGRLDEVMTWEYPNGSFWNNSQNWRPGMRHG